MKKIVLSVVIMIISFGLSFAQDAITKRNGEDILAKVLEVGNTDIKYKRFDNQEGPTFTIAKTDILLIKYQNGSKDVFTDVVEKSSANEVDLYTNGQTDALKYYEGYKSAGTGTLITSLLSPLVGLIPAVACSSSQPKDENLDYPSSELMKNPNYYQGYTKKAKKIKQNKVWKNWGIAFGVNLALVLALSSSAQ